MNTFRPFDVSMDRDFVINALYDTKSLTGELPDDPLKDGESLIAGISKIQEKNPVFASVMLEETEKIGFVFCFPLEKHKEIGCLCFDYIIESKRGMGQGRNLMDYVVDILKGQGCNEIILDVSKKNTCAIKFYEKSGFKISGQRDKKHYKMRKTI
ncbi:GNAT family N-acetyltransferase [candidate division WOR-3 bacterium]|nr:GNAT family N-acetyltransferase [candidate division WOR-3 bacterium]